MSEYRSAQTNVVSVACIMLLWHSVGTPLLGARASSAAGQNRGDDARANSQERLQAVDQALTGIFQAAAHLQQRLGSIVKACEFGAERLPDLIQRREKEKERLRERAGQLEKENAEIEVLLRGAGPGDSNVPEEVAKARARKKWLLEEITRYPDPFDAKGNPEFVTVPESMKPVTFLLSGNRVTPLDQEYFKVKSVRYKGKQYVVIEKEQDGQLVTEAINQGGCLEACVSEIDPEKKYIMLLVCPDGVGSFERVVKKIKENKDKNEKVKERNITCVWTPKDEPPWVVDTERIGQPSSPITGF